MLTAAYHDEAGEAVDALHHATLQARRTTNFALLATM